MPLRKAVEAARRMIRRLLGPDARPHPLRAGNAAARAADLANHEGDLQRRAAGVFGGLPDLAELEVSDVMVHRTNMRGINLDEPPAKIVDEVLASPFTRLPLWRGEPENIVGILHIKDLLRAFASARGEMSALDVAAIATPPWFVPDTTSLQAQLNEFLRRKTHFALVVDEYGEVMGLVTLEDILEEIVGDIADEHDVAVEGVRPQSDGTVLADGAVPVRDLNRALGWSLPDEEATTIAGLVIHEARTIPEPGQEFTFHGYRFKVLRKSRNRITQLRVAPLQIAAPAPT